MGMKIMVSACLLGTNCKYNGGNNRNEKVLQFLKGHEVIPVCPEVMGGLPVPRKPAEIINGKVYNKEGISVDREFREGAEKALQMALEKKVDLVILKARSPSCGPGPVYDGTFSHTLTDGMGIFARMLKEHHIPYKTEEELERGG
jgi:uncharacterized protein YbbK (DUF523 family)